MTKTAETSRETKRSEAADEEEMRAATKTRRRSAMRAKGSGQRRGR
jgi:hypothetical protein